MDKIKKIIIILTIITFALILIIIALKCGQTNSEQLETNTSTNTEETAKSGFTQINDYETYYKAKAILNKYIVYVRQINGDEKIETGKLDMTEDEIKATLQEQGIKALKELLDKQYLEEMFISDEELKLKQNKYENNDETYNLNIEDIFKMDLDENITIILTNAKLNNEDFKTLIKLDKLNDTYSIFLDDFMEKYDYSKDMSKQDINITTEAIDENSFNSKIKVNTTETNIVSQYFVEYKGKMVNDTKVAYELLNEEYRQKKYGSYENFENYVKNNEKKILYSSIDKYQVTENDGIKKYICVDKEGKYYIFIEKDITHYEVILDTYTIDLPEFLQKYNNNEDEIKCGMNIQKLFDAINDEDYSYAYNKLDDTFKQNNFSNEETFRKYAEIYLKNKELKFEKCEENGQIYIYDITLTEENQNTETKTIVMKLLEGTDFVFSFNIK